MKAASASCRGEGASGIYDYGSHNFDMANYFNDECNTNWVLCGLDYSQES